MCQSRSLVAPVRTLVSHQGRAIIGLVLVMSGLIVWGASFGAASAKSSENGVTNNESATLWSRDADHRTGGAIHNPSTDNRTAVQQLANGTDFTFRRPPATAATWSRNDFESLDGSGAETAIHPPHASLVDGLYIKDAHTTIFGVHPSTRVHTTPEDTPRYVAPEGAVRGFVDYRIRVPAGSDTGNVTSEWTLLDYRIENVRLTHDEQLIREINGTHTPTIEYALDRSGSTTLTLTAEIHVQLQKTTQIHHSNGTTVYRTTRTETRVVSDTIEGEIYDPASHIDSITYPNGNTGVAIFLAQPWQGYTLNVDGTTQVRGTWRFYTARDPRWDTLVKSSRNTRQTINSDAVPVFVHAYPSRIEPRIDPVGSNVSLIDTWGRERASPANTIGKNVSVNVVSQPYVASYGVAVRATTLDQSPIHAAGIVRGTNVTLSESPLDSTRKVRHVDLSVSIRDQNRTAATLLIELTDAKTRAPIVLDETSHQSPKSTQERRGTITVADREVRTNSSGIVVVTLSRPGIYTVQYQPGSWISHDPAYVEATTTVRWHPLTTIAGWTRLLVALVWRLVPILFVLYAGRQLLTMWGGRSHFGGR